MSPDSLLLFFSLALLLALSPGPDNLFVLMQSLLLGPLAGVVITLGLCSGLMVHTTLVALGVALLFKTSALVFTLLKLLGVGYLLYLAWGTWRAAVLPLSAAEPATADYWALYLRGVVMNVTNPKVSLFFLAILPQFVDSSAASAVNLQIALLGLLFAVAALLVFSGIALLAGRLGSKLSRSPSLQGGLNRLAALVLLGLAIHLALLQR